MPHSSGFITRDASDSVLFGATTTQASSRHGGLQQVQRNSTNSTRQPLGEIDGNPQRGSLNPPVRPRPSKTPDTTRIHSSGGFSSGKRHNGSVPSGPSKPVKAHPSTTQHRDFLHMEGMRRVAQQSDINRLRPQTGPPPTASATPEKMGSKSLPLPSSLPHQLNAGNVPSSASRQTSAHSGSLFTQGSLSTRRLSRNQLFANVPQSTAHDMQMNLRNEEQREYLHRIRDARVTKDRQPKRVQQLAGNKFVQAVQKQEKQERLTRRTGQEQSSRSPDDLEETIQMLHNTALGGGAHARPSIALRPHHGGRPPGSSTSQMQHENAGPKTGATNDQPAQTVESKASALLARLFSQKNLF